MVLVDAEFDFQSEKSTTQKAGDTMSGNSNEGQVSRRRTVISFRY
jgi:hypothetical protein